jgi:hypothetical protein
MQAVMNSANMDSMRHHDRIRQAITTKKTKDGQFMNTSMQMSLPFEQADPIEGGSPG